MLLALLLALSACTGGLSELPDTGDTQPADADADGDGVPDADDACPDDPWQWTDADADGVCDERDDACPDDPAGSVDTDGDGVCVPADACPGDADAWEDTDGDGVCDPYDDCPDQASGHVDLDGDGHCEGEDACPDNPDEWIDTDGDGACDGDDDCPGDPGGWVDSTGDGVCDDLDDTDGDGIADYEERVYGDDCTVSDPTDRDTDHDGVPDGLDPYPRDRYPEYILFRNDVGTIDVLLSHRDGTFADPVEIGIPYGGTTDLDYRYVSFAISDFNGDGETDFLAIGATGATGDDYDVWWFWRQDHETTFAQRKLGTWSRGPLRIVADLDNDARMDLVDLEIVKPANITEATLRFYGNQGTIESATCFATEDPANPADCAFVVSEALDATPFAANQWKVGVARDAIDVDGDGNRDVALYRYSSGGNAPTDVTVALGQGDGTFSGTLAPLATHNSGGCGSSPVNSILFADFDSDTIGDVIMGLDDDGDAGSAWLYPGVRGAGGYALDTRACIEAFDLEPTYESGGEHPGYASSARSFDFDFDGNTDVIVGYNDSNPWAPPSANVLLMGRGDGTFDDPIEVRRYPDSSWAATFAIPQRMCAFFPVD